MPTDVYIDPLTGDLPDFTRYVIEEELALQKLRIRLGTVLGEYILDQFVGLPYPEWSQQKPPRVNEIAGIVLATILGNASSGILRVDDFAAVFEPLPGSTSRLLFTGTVIFDPGDTTQATLRAEVLGSRDNTTPALLFFGDIGPITGVVGGIG